MGDIETKFVKYPPPVSQAGRYMIAQQNDRQTRYGRSKHLILANSKGEKFSLFVNYPQEASDTSTLARLVQAFGTDPEKWIGRKIDVSFDENGRRRIDPLIK